MTSSSGEDLQSLPVRRIQLLDDDDDERTTLRIHERYSHSATDSVVWDAGIVLAKHLAFQHCRLEGGFSLKGKTVLDIGSGTGVSTS